MEKVTAENVTEFMLKYGNRSYRKKVTTRAARIPEPFEVETFEGTLICQDGYLAIDARGYPYPIAKDEFELIYEEIA